MKQQPLLSILICSLHKRIDKLSNLLSTLNPQVDSYPGQVELIVNMDNKILPTGKKRQLLLEQATGEYIVFIDDDDHIDQEYVSLIISALSSRPDCVATTGWYTSDNDKKTIWFLSKDLKNENKNGFFYRTTNHISPVRRDLALQVGFKPISFGEDADYSERLKPLLKSETKINKLIYHYDFKSTNKEY
jgi:glycosyltransferase involved in cell wall biosynthesis